MTEQNQFDENLPEAAEATQPTATPDAEIPAAPIVLVPVTAEEHDRERRRLRLMIAAALAVAIAFTYWIYRRNVDPIHALEAFDAGERLLKSARYSQAIASFNSAISLKSDYAEAYTMRARANMALQRPLQAIPDFTTVIEMRPTDAQALLDRGSALMTINEPDKAIADFSKAIELDPKLALAYNLRGSAVRGKGDIQRALLDFEKAVEVLPDMNNIFQRGATYQMLGQHEKAIADFSRIISMEPGSAQGYFARAQSYRAMGDIASANRDHRTGRIMDGR